MKLSTFDLGRVRALHHLLEEVHVGRAAQRLGITPAAASNALRRLRADFCDPLLVKNGRGVARTRMGEDLRAPARAVIAAAEQLTLASRPFDPAIFSGQLAIAMADHVAAVLLPELDQLVRTQAPHATLAIASPPNHPLDWLERTRGVLVGPVGRFGATEEADGTVTSCFYNDSYVAAFRTDHPCAGRHWTATAYAELDHILVVPRGRTARSDIDELLAGAGLVRRVGRIVPSFTLALPLIRESDLVTTMPELYARSLQMNGIILRELPLPAAGLVMKLITHPAHKNDAGTVFSRTLLRAAYRAALLRQHPKS